MGVGEGMKLTVAGAGEFKCNFLHLVDDEVYNLMSKT